MCCDGRETLERWDCTLANRRIRCSHCGKWALSAKHNHIGASFTTPTKVTESGCIPSYCICWNISSTFCPCSYCTSQYHGCPNNHILRWNLVEHNPSLLNAPTFCIHVHEATPYKDIRPQTTLKYLLTQLPCWKSCITFSGSSSFTYFVSFWFYAKMFDCTVPGANAAISTATHGTFCWLSSQSALCVFLCLRSTFYLSTTRNWNQADQPCIIHIPGINDTIRREKAGLSFSISILHLLAFSSILLYCIYLPSPSTSPIYINEPTTKPCDTLNSAYPPKYPTSPFPPTKLSKAFQFTLRILNINLILVIIIFPPTMFKPINKIVQWFYQRNQQIQHCQKQFMTIKQCEALDAIKARP